MSGFEQYDHHNARVWVRTAFKDKRAEHSLCFSCGRVTTCHVAITLFDLLVDHKVGAPVYECPEFVLIDFAKPHSTAE